MFFFSVSMFFMTFLTAEIEKWLADELESCSLKSHKASKLNYLKRLAGAFDKLTMSGISQAISMPIKFTMYMS